jgi:uncharacterized protein YhfF
VQIPTRRIEFGWPDDRGVGEMLVAQVRAGSKWATCGFKRAYDRAELAEARLGRGELHAVCSAADPRPRAIVRVTDVFLTPFGDPDPQLVAGEGDGQDAEKFRRDHRVAWAADFGEAPLEDDELLVVELFELVALVEENGTVEPLKR